MKHTRKNSPRYANYRDLFTVVNCFQIPGSSLTVLKTKQKKEQVKAFKFLHNFGSNYVSAVRKRLDVDSRHLKSTFLFQQETFLKAITCKSFVTFMGINFNRNNIIFRNSNWSTTKENSG